MNKHYCNSRALQLACDTKWAMPSMAIIIFCLALFASHSALSQTQSESAKRQSADHEVLTKGDLLTPEEPQIPINSNLPERARISELIDHTNFNKDPRLLIEQLMQRAEIDKSVGANISALQDLQFAYRLANNANLQDLVANIAYKIAIIHQIRGEHGIALSYAEQALTRSQSLQNTNKQMSIQLLLIKSLLATEKWPLARSRIDSMARFINERGTEAQQALYYQLLGEVELADENIEASLVALNRAEELTENENSNSLANLRLLASKAHSQQQNMDAAIAALVEAFEFSSGGQLSFVLYQALQLQRAELLSQLNEYEAAYNVMQNVVKDRLREQPISDIKRMLDMHANFQLNIQQQENAELKQENEWKSMQLETKQKLSTLYLIVMGLLLCLTGLLLLFLIRGRKHRSHLEQLAHTDQLTGLHSRARTLELLNHHQQLFARTRQEYCVAILDLDYFKRINDTYGHQVGDKVLQQFGGLCQDSFRKSDIIGRIGGEEFLFILPNTPANRAQEVFQHFAKRMLNIGRNLELSQATTASVGLVSPMQEEKVLQIIKRADDALYKAKNNGRNCVVFDEDITTLQTESTEVN